MKARTVLIVGLVTGAVSYYLLKPFGINYGYASFLENVFGDNKNMGLAFTILYIAVLIFVLYKFYKFIKIKFDFEWIQPK